MVITNTFVRLTVNTYEDVGAPLGSIIYVAGLRALPIDEDDIYLQRVFAIGHLVKEGYSIDLNNYLFDPREAETLSEEESKPYFEQLEIDFGGPEEGETIN